MHIFCSLPFLLVLIGLIDNNAQFLLSAFFACSYRLNRQTMHNFCSLPFLLVLIGLIGKPCTFFAICLFCSSS